MSHVADVRMHFKDLDALKQACDEIGLEFMENQKTYKWYGQYVGDYPLPKGFTAKELGHCEHAIRVKGNAHAYEIGVLPRRDGEPGYTLLYDFWAGGQGLEAIVGRNAKRLSQAYAVRVGINKMEAKGCRVREVERRDGKREVVFARVRR